MKYGKILAALCLVFAFSLIIGCGPSYPNCETDEHCKDYGEFCVDKLCRKCRNDDDCTVKNKCKACDPNTYTCEHRPGCCTNDLDCPGGRCWVEPGQATGNCGAMCRNDSDCKPGEKCEFGACKPGAECTDDSMCGPNQRCENGMCVDRPACQGQPVYFDYNESVLTAEARSTLGQNTSCFQSRNESVKIEGHCDERGTDEYNLALGQRRAGSAKQYLMSSGWSRLSTVSYGEERPICRESNEGCWSRNRRAEFVFE